MSTPIPPLPHQSPTTTTTTTSVSLGYGIAIAISILVLISTIMLASYACVRVRSSSRFRHNDNNDNDNDNDDGTQNESHQLRPNTTTGLPGPVLVKMGKDMKPKKGVLYPQVVLGESKRLPKPNTGPCPICLSEYKAKQIVRCMPNCNHCFHIDCVDQWLKMSPTCPLCRNSPLPSMGPTPAMTPLSEVVPLAFHSR